MKRVQLALVMQSPFSLSKSEPCVTVGQRERINGGWLRACRRVKFLGRRDEEHLSSRCFPVPLCVYLCACVRAFLCTCAPGHSVSVPQKHGGRVRCSCSGAQPGRRG